MPNSKPAHAKAKSAPRPTSRPQNAKPRKDPSAPAIPATPIQNSITVNLDSLTGIQRWFRDSRHAELRSREMTLPELVQFASAIAGLAPEAIALAGLIRECKEKIKAWDARNRGVSGPNSGLADDRLAELLPVLQANGTVITPYSLGRAAKTNHLTAYRWLELHHPEMLSGAPSIRS